MILLYTLVTLSIYKPWWVGFSIGFWIGIAQFTVIIFLKYYQSYYQMNFMIQICLFFGIGLFAAWTAVMAVYVFAYYRDVGLAVVAFCIASFGYAFLFMLSIGFLKLLSV